MCGQNPLLMDIWNISSLWLFYTVLQIHVKTHMHICIFVCFPGGANGKKKKNKNQPAIVGDMRDSVSILGQEDPLEEDMAIHSS